MPQPADFGDGPAIEALLTNEPLTLEHIAALRGYFRQWINAPIWNRHAGEEEMIWLAQMRADIDGLTSRPAIERWLERVIDGGIDPL